MHLTFRGKAEHRTTHVLHIVLLAGQAQSAVNTRREHAKTRAAELVQTARIKCRSAH